MSGHRCRDGDPYTPGAGDERYEVAHYELRLRYRVSTNRLDGRAVLDVRVLQETGSLRLDMAGLRAVSVSVDGRAPAAVRHRERLLQLRLRRRAAPGERLRVEVDYRGRPAPRRTPWGEIGWEELADGALVSGQPIGASTWFPCNDRPGYKAAFSVSIAVERGYTAVCNGVWTGRRQSSGGQIWSYEQREPTAVYLATAQIGRYAAERLDEGRGGVPVRLVAPPRLQRAARREFAVLPAAIARFGELFGPYPFPEYTVVVTADDLEIPLESQGLATFGANHVRPATAEPRLVVHELAHMWFGNSVGLRHWRDIWLNEGFACYAEWLWSEHLGDESAERLARRHHARLEAMGQELLLADPGARLMFDDRVYKRGALCLHALRLRLGEARFFALLRAWTDRYRHGLVESADFERLAAEHAGEPLDELFGPWLRERRLPPFPLGPRA